MNGSACLPRMMRNALLASLVASVVPLAPGAAWSAPSPIRLTSPKGSELHPTYQTFGEPIDAASFVLPSGPDGNIWTLQSYSEPIPDSALVRYRLRLMRVSQRGQILSRFPLPADMTLTSALVSGPGPYVWTAFEPLPTTGQATLLRINTVGEMTSVPLSDPAALRLPGSPGSTLTSGWWPGVQGGDGNLWFSRSTGGVARINPATGAVSSFPPMVAGHVTRGPDGGIWHLGFDAATRLNADGSVFKTLRYPKRALDAAWGAKYLWLGGKGFIARMTATGQVTSYRLPHGGCDVIIELMPGSRDTVWFHVTRASGSCAKSVYLGRLTGSGQFNKIKGQAGAFLHASRTTLHASRKTLWRLTDRVTRLTVRAPAKKRP